MSRCHCGDCVCDGRGEVGVWVAGEGGVNVLAEIFGVPSAVVVGGLGLGSAVEHDRGVGGEIGAVFAGSGSSWPLRGPDTDYSWTRGGHISSLLVTVSPSCSLRTTIENRRVPTWAYRSERLRVR